jgi:hypothetical protein
MTTTSAAPSVSERTSRIRAGLGRRHLTERLFRGFGVAAIVLALGFVTLLFADVLLKGIPAFTQSNLHLAVTYDPEVITTDPAPIRAAGQSDADFRAARLGWERQVAMLNWNRIVEAALRDPHALSPWHVEQLARGADEHRDVVTGIEQLRHHAAADVPGRAGDEDSAPAHADPFRSGDLSRMAASWSRKRMTISRSPGSNVSASRSIR